MSIIKSTSARNAACDAVVDLIDIGSTYAQGSLKIYDSDSSVLVSLNMSNPAYGDATAGISTAASITDSTAFADGTATSFSIFDRDGTSVFDGTVTTLGGGGDLELNPNYLVSDATISIDSASFTVPV